MAENKTTRITNMTPNVRIMRDGNGNNVTLNPGEARDVELTEDDAKFYGGGKTKAYRVGSGERRAPTGAGPGSPGSAGPDDQGGAGESHATSGPDANKDNTDTSSSRQRIRR